MKAQNKEDEVSVIETFSDRVKVFEKEMIDLMKKHNVGVKPILDASQEGIRPTIAYVDIKKKEDEGSGNN